MDQLTLRGLNCCTTPGLLTATGAATTYDTTVTINYVIRGIIRQKAAITAGVTPLLDGNTGVAFRTLTANQGCALVWSLNAAGTVVLLQGPTTTMVGGTFDNAPQFPAIPETVAPFAYSILKAGATAGVITIGTSNWNATGFTSTHTNIMYLPDRPAVL